MKKNNLAVLIFVIDPIYGKTTTVTTIEDALKNFKQKIILKEEFGEKRWVWEKENHGSLTCTVGKGISSTDMSDDDIIGVYETTNIDHLKNMVNDAQKVSGGTWIPPGD